MRTLQGIPGTYKFSLTIITSKEANVDDFLAPPVPVQPNIVVPQPSQAELQVGSKSSTQQRQFGLTLSASGAIGLKIFLTTSHTQPMD
jgi:hypothetical protein